MSELKPAALARIDQAQARLRDLVEQIRAHHAAGCGLPNLCHGGPANRTLYDLTCHEREELLVAAIVALANTNYQKGQPT